jgi:vacuolar protein sorting-associated protein 52
MTSLQEKSNKMNTSLGNKKKVQGLLASFIDSAVLDKELIDAICTAPIDDNYVTHIRLLLKKLSTPSPMQTTSTATSSRLTPKP